jgi:hypothetical protein
LHRDQICGAQENGNLPKEIGCLDLVKLPALSHNVFDRLEQALQNNEKPRVFSFACHPISSLHADIRRFLSKPLALGLLEAGEDRYL